MRLRIDVTVEDRLLQPAAQVSLDDLEQHFDVCIGRAVAGVVGTIFLDQPNSAYAEFGWIPGCVLSL